MQTKAQRELGQLVPKEYVALLRLTNGLQINNVLFKKAEELVFDGRDRRFHIANLGSPNERFSSFDSLAALLVEALREQQVL